MIVGPADRAALFVLGAWMVVVGVLSTWDPSHYLSYPGIWGAAQTVIGIGFTWQVWRASARSIPRMSPWAILALAYCLARMVYVVIAIVETSEIAKGLNRMAFWAMPTTLVHLLWRRAITESTRKA